MSTCEKNKAKVTEVCNFKKEMQILDFCKIGPLDFWQICYEIICLYKLFKCSIVINVLE